MEKCPGYKIIGGGSEEDIKQAKKSELQLKSQELNNLTILSQVASGERPATERLKSEFVKKFAEDHNLDIRESISPEGVELPEQYIIANKEKALNVIKDKIVEFESRLPALKDKINELNKMIAEMPIAQAVNFISRYKRSKEKLMEEPETAVLEGLLFGYKVCDIEYYVNTRHFGIEQYENEQSDPVDQHLLCKNCAIAITEKVSKKFPYT